MNKWYTGIDFQYIKEWNWRLDYKIRFFFILRGGSKNVVNNGLYTSQVTDFSWSHDGRMALICYCDGFVLVGSVAGQMYWSSMLNLDQTTITCGVWSPDDQQVSSPPPSPHSSLYLYLHKKWCPTGEIFCTHALLTPTSLDVYNTSLPVFCDKFLHGDPYLCNSLFTKRVVLIPPPLHT